MKIDLVMTPYTNETYEYKSNKNIIKNYIKYDETDKPKFKMSLEEMIQFNDDLNEACNACPQYSNDY